MFNRTSFIRVVPIAALAAFLITACNETASENAEDVAEARQEASENIREAREDASDSMYQNDENVADARHDYTETDNSARADMNSVESDAMSDRADSDYEIAITEAEGIEDVATEKCGVLSGEEKNACMSAAAANFEASKAQAIAERDAARVAASDRQ